MAMERHCIFYDFRGVPGELKEENPLYGLYRFKKGFGGEGMWVRYKDVEGTDFYGVLLNQPNQDLGVNMGDRVKFHLTKDKDDKVFCFCDLDE